MAARRLAATGCLLLAATLGPAHAQRARPPLTGMPNVAILYYEVSGRTAEQIRAAIDRHPRRPRDPNDGRPVDAAARWDFRWTWPEDARGECDLARVGISFGARVLMPRLADEAAVPAPLLRRWRIFIARLAAHEDRHVFSAWRAMPELLATLRASRCADANAAAERLLSRIRQREVDYDRRSDHGLREGVRFP